MKQFVDHFLHGLPYIVVLAVLLLCPALRAFALCNMLVQGLLFLAVVIVPALKTRRMSYVDIGWPVGLALIGVQVLIFSDGLTWRSGIIAMFYLLAGGRMAAMALIGWRHGFLDRELPRYQYQRQRWQRHGWRETPALLYEVASQGAANMSVLALPALLQAANPAPTLSTLEWLGYALWLLAFAFEFVADRQKNRFGQRMRGENRKGEVCREGLWRYSRHPNYFGEWMLWNALMLSSVSSLHALSDTTPLWQVQLLFMALMYMSYLMYGVLVYYSGAVPAEFYSLQKRTGYADYQQRTNMFFPWREKQPRAAKP
jgi:steroid 5-alpha reductase family enzyme